MEHNLSKSEFSVSETTAKVLRLRNLVQKAYNDAADIFGDDGGGLINEKDYIAMCNLFGELDETILVALKNTIYEVTASTDCDECMI